MKKLLLVTAAAVLMTAGSAMAADVAMAPVYDWTGFYVGANAGYGFGGDDKVGVNPGGNVGDLKIHGIFGGVQGGYNYQMNSIVLGIETDIQLSNVSDNDTGGRLISSSSDVNYFGTLRGRAGVAFDKALIYGTGGLAYAGVDYSVQPPLGGGLKDQYTEVGYTVGGGLEYAFDDVWTMKAEYLFIDLGHRKISNGAVSTVATPSFQTVRIGVNYRF